MINPIFLFNLNIWHDHIMHVFGKQSNKAEIEHALVLLAVFTKKYQPWFIKTNSKRVVKKGSLLKSNVSKARNIKAKQET